MPRQPSAPRGVSAQPAPATPMGQPAASDAWWEAAPVVQEPAQAPVAPPRQVGVLETMGRTALSAAIPIVRSIDMAAAGVAGMLAPMLGLNAEEEQAKVFRDAEVRSARMRQMYEPQAGEQMSKPGQIMGGIASIPLEMAGGMGVQRGVERSADVVQRGGTMGEAAVAGGVTGAANVAANLLPVKAGGAVGRVVENALGRGLGARAGQVAGGALTGGVLGAAGDVGVTKASNLALPEGQQFADLKQEADPLTSFGLGAAFGGLGAHGERVGARKAAEAAGEPATSPVAEKKPSLDPETLRLAQKARDYDIPLRPDMLSDSKIAKYVGDVLEKVPLGGSKAPERQKAFNRAVMDQLGADSKAEALTPEVFDEAISRAGKEIGDISARTAVPEASFGNLDTVARRELPGVQQVVGTYVEDLRQIAADHGGVVPGDRLRKLRTDAATKARSTGDGDLRQALGKFVDRLDDAIEKHASKDDIEALSDARRRYAVAKTLEPLVAKSATGDISPAALMGRVTADRAGKSRMARGRGGELGDLARIGQKFLKEPPSSGTAERLAAGGAVAGVGLGSLLSPATATAAAATVGGANLYNRLGSKLVDRRLAKEAAMAAPEEAKAPAPTEVAAVEPTAQAAAPAAPPDPRLAEIDRLRPDASPETLKVLDERAAAVQKDIKAQEVKAARDTEALKLEAAAAKTTDAELKGALIDRANKLRSEKIPVAEAQELTSIPIETTKPGRIPAGKATELAEVPGPRVTEPGKPLPVGAAREVTVLQQEPAQAIEPTQIPTGEATELTAETVEPAPRPPEPARSVAGSDVDAELTMLQPGAPARGMASNRVAKPEAEKRGALPAKPFKQRRELETALRAKLGHKLVDGLLQRNVITMGDAPADVPRDAQGRFTGSTVELFHDRLDAATAPGVLMHEVGMHYGMEKMLGEQRYAELLADLAKMRQRPEVAKAWQAVVDNYPLKEGSPEFLSEVAAHLVESAPDRPIVRRMLDAPRAYLYKNFGVNISRTDPALVRALAVGALRKSAGVEAVSPNPTALATAGARQEEEAVAAQ